MYTNEIAVTGHLFKKQIILYGKIQTDVLRLWKVFKDQNKDIEKQIKNEFQINQTIDLYQLVSKVGSLFSSMANKFPNIDPREFDFKDSRTVRSIKRLAYDCILKNNTNTKHVFDILKNHAMKNSKQKDWYKMYLKINPNIQIINNQVFRRNIQNESEKYNKNEAKKLENIYDLLNSNQVTQRQNLGNNPNNNFIQSNYENLDLKSDPLLSLTPRHNANEKDSIFNILNIRDPKCQKSNPCREATEIQLMKQKDDKKENDQQYQHQLSLNLNPFPEMVIRQQKIFDTLALHKCRIEFNFNLLAEIIALEASGTLITTPSSVNPSQGESIHCLSHELFTLQAYRKDKESNFINSVLNFLNMNFTSIGLVNNNPLPKWLNYSINDDIINIWGFPQPSEDDQILIRIINNTGFTIHSFIIFIQDNQGKDMKNQSLVKLATLQSSHSPRKKDGKQLHTSVNFISQSLEQNLNSKGNTNNQKNNNTQSYKIDQSQNVNQKSSFANFNNLKSQNLKISNKVQTVDEQIQLEQVKPQSSGDDVERVQEDFQIQGNYTDESQIDIEIPENQLEIQDKREIKQQDFKQKQK